MGQHLSGRALYECLSISVMHKKKGKPFGLPFFCEANLAYAAVFKMSLSVVLGHITALNLA